MSKTNDVDGTELELDCEEEDLIPDGNTCSNSEIQQAFSVKYKIAHESAISLTNDYITAIAVDKYFGKLAAGVTNGNIAIFDINNTRLSRLLSFNLIASAAVCGLRFADETENLLLAGSTNGAINMYDLRTGKKEFVFDNSLYEVKSSITSFDINANSRVICCGTEITNNDVYLYFYDFRQRGIMGTYWDTHNDDVTNVKFHPMNPDLLCTGSTDGLINLFDISASSEEDALIGTMNTESSVQKLSWHKNVYKKDIISCITHTDDLKMYECEEQHLLSEFDRSQVTAAIRRKADSNYTLVSCHDLDDDGGVLLLANSNSMKGEVTRSVQVQGNTLIPHAVFIGNKQIIRDSVYNHKLNLVATAGESGIVTLWSTEAIDQNQPKNTLKAKKKSIKQGKTPY